MAEEGVDSHVEAKNVVVGVGAEKEFCRDRGFDFFGDGGYRRRRKRKGPPFPSDGYTA